MCQLKFITVAIKLQILLLLSAVTVSTEHL